MPSASSISPIDGLSPVGPARQQPRQKASKVVRADATQSDTPSVATDTPHFTDPDSCIDPATNLVVMAFRNTAGAVINQFPTQQQLDAYRQGSANSPDSSD